MPSTYILILAHFRTLCHYLVRISLFALAHIEEEPGRACGLTHLVIPYSNRCSLGVSLLLL
jgi:hypothetical protein